MKVLIFGASGATGRHLVVQALLQGHEVTAFVRNISKLNIDHSCLKIIAGNVTDFHLINSIMQGQDAVVSALGAQSPFKYDQTIVDGVQNIVRAMENNGVQRFIYLSFAGVKKSRHQAGFVIKHIAPLLLKTEIKGHQQREKLIQQTRLLWTIVRPATLTNGKKLLQYRAGENIISNGFVVSISRADVASFMLQQLNDNLYLHQSPLLMY
jgi:putative NADH-flavin reductase